MAEGYARTGDFYSALDWVEKCGTISLGLTALKAYALIEANRVSPEDLAMIAEVVLRNPELDFSEHCLAYLVSSGSTNPLPFDLSDLWRKALDRSTYNLNAHKNYVRLLGVFGTREELAEESEIFQSSASSEAESNEAMALYSGSCFRYMTVRAMQRPFSKLTWLTISGMWP